MGGSLGAWRVSLGTCGVLVNMGSLTLSFQVQNDQCQPTVEESRWMRTTEKGWEFHSVSVRWEVTSRRRPSNNAAPASLVPPVERRCSTRPRRGQWVVTDRDATHPLALVPAPSSAAGSPTHGAKPTPGGGITQSRGVPLPGGPEPWEQRAVLADHRLLRLVQGA